MKPFSFFVQVAAAGAVLAIGNWALDRMSVNSVPRQLLRHAAEVHGPTDIFLGNSTMAAGLDQQAFATARPGSTPLNLGLGSSSPVEHLLIYLKQDGPPADHLVYGFLDTQLTDPAEGDWHTLIYNRAMCYYAGIETAIQYYAPDDPVKATTLRLAAHVPMSVERTSAWAKVERMRRRLASLGMPSRRTNRFGRAEDFAMLEPDDEQKFAARCAAAAADGTPLSPQILAMLRRAKALGTTAFVVEMPMPQRHRQRFYDSAGWKAYRNHVEKLVAAEGGVYIAAAEWVEDNGFEDHVHLNKQGARIFSSRLAKEIGGN